MLGWIWGFKLSGHSCALQRWLGARGALERGSAFSCFSVHVNRQFCARPEARTWTPESVLVGTFMVFLLVPLL